MLQTDLAPSCVFVKSMNFVLLVVLISWLVNRCFHYQDNCESRYRMTVSVADIQSYFGFLFYCESPSPVVVAEGSACTMYPSQKQVNTTDSKLKTEILYDYLLEILWLLFTKKKRCVLTGKKCVVWPNVFELCFHDYCDKIVNCGHVGQDNHNVNISDHTMLNAE